MTPEQKGLLFIYLSKFRVEKVHTIEIQNFKETYTCIECINFTGKKYLKIIRYVLPFSCDIGIALLANKYLVFFIQPCIILTLYKITANKMSNRRPAKTDTRIIHHLTFLVDVTSDADMSVVICNTYGQ